MKQQAKINENIFFRESTIRICGSLDIESALCACIRYLEKFMPASRIFLQHYERSLGAMRTIATATPSGGERTAELTHLSPTMIAAIEKMRRSRRNAGSLAVEQPQVDRISSNLLKEMLPPETSFMFTFLDIDDQMVGAVVLIAEGRNLYTAKHRRLFRSLRDPFSIAMVNARRHAEIVQLKNTLADDNQYLFQELHPTHGQDIVGADSGLHDVMAMVRQVAPLESPVLLLGETGVGKDVIANAIHFLSMRNDRPFIRVNSGAIPDTLIDSELFGHEKGAFTGAHEQKRGRFERAQAGTIFLDEIRELPPQAQVRMLKVLETKEIERVGGTKSIPVNVRVVAATHRNLEEMVRTHQFREDLWFRLNVFPIVVPPLRYRKDDIQALAQHFIALKTKQNGFSQVPQLSLGAVDQLKAYDWPGNVRELENVIERAIILNPSGPLEFVSLLAPAIPFSNDPQVGQKPAFATLNLDQVNANHIRRVLAMTGGKIYGPTGAAALMGIHPNTLANRMKKLGIAPKNYRKKGDVATIDDQAPSRSDRISSSSKS